MRRKIIYTKSFLLFALTLFLTTLSAQDVISAAVDSVIEGHNTCDQCHGRYPGAQNAGKGKKNQPAKIPADKVDLLCLGCHGPAGISRLKADIHGAKNYVIASIGCIDCHDPHTNARNYIDGQNIKLIGSNQSSVYASITTPNSGERFVVFESRGTDTGEPSMYSFADSDQDKDGSFSGICEVCHTQTKFHKNNPSGNHNHYTGQTCTNCHVHINQFLAFTEDPITTQELSGSIIDDSGFAWSGITLFIDINGNGVYDAGEPTAVTDGKGYFTFNGIKNKGYNILLMPGSLPDVFAVSIRTVKNVVVITVTSKILKYPMRLTWKSDGGYLVTDYFGDAIFIYDADGKLISKLKGLNKPLGLTTDTSGRIFVGNDGRGNVEIYSASGILQATIGNGQIKKPNDIALDRDQRLYVVDSISKHIRAFNPDGSDALIVGQSGPNMNEFLNLRALAIHYRMDSGVEKGELYAGDTSTALIKVFDLDGNLLRTLGVTSSGGGGMGMSFGPTKLFHGIQSLEFDQFGRLHVLDTYEDRVHIIDPVTGDSLGEYDTDVTGQGAQLPMDIAISPTGQVIMTSAKTKSVESIYMVQ